MTTNPLQQTLGNIHNQSNIFAPQQWNNVIYAYPTPALNQQYLHINNIYQPQINVPILIPPPVTFPSNAPNVQIGQYTQYGNAEITQAQHWDEFRAMINNFRHCLKPQEPQNWFKFMTYSISTSEIPLELISNLRQYYKFSPNNENGYNYIDSDLWQKALISLPNNKCYPTQISSCYQLSERTKLCYNDLASTIWKHHNWIIFNKQAYVKIRAERQGWINKNNKMKIKIDFAFVKLNQKIFRLLKKMNVADVDHGKVGEIKHILNNINNKLKIKTVGNKEELLLDYCKRISDVNFDVVRLENGEGELEQKGERSNSEGWNDRRDIMKNRKERVSEMISVKDNLMKEIFKKKQILMCLMNDSRKHFDEKK